jgi:carbon monoxide dehydrogenase subunit G
MIVEGEYSFSGKRQAVWDLLLDAEVIGRAMPGGRSLSRVAADRYEGLMQVGIGPITAAEFTVAIGLRDVNPPTSYQMVVDGQGRFGFTRGTADVKLADGEGGGGTVMTYRADLMVGGKIASLGQRLLDTVSRMMTRRGLDSLAAELRRRLGGDSSGGAADSLERTEKAP